jgi:pimeloyl-ACP methyl ester carboxylesterase
LTTNNLPTIVLIGGGWHLPATYSKLTKALEAAGYEVHVPLLPSMNGARPPTASLAEDTTAVRNYVVNLIDAGHTVAAIMHSYGGQVGTNALHGLGLEQHAREGKSGGVSKLIYMCAFALPENSSMIGKVEEMGDSALMPLVFDFDEDGTVVSRDPKTFLVGEGDEKEIEEYVGGFRRWNGKGMYDCIERCAWRDDIPVSYIFAKSDMTVPLRYQEDMVEKVRAEVRSVETYEVDSGHCPNHTKTKEIVEIVGKAVGRK